MTAAAVFVAVSHWMQRASCKSKQASRMAEAAEKLAACIRFPMLTNDFLHFVAAQVHSSSTASLSTCSGAKPMTKEVLVYYVCAVYHCCYYRFQNLICCTNAAAKQTGVLFGLSCILD